MRSLGPRDDVVLLLAGVGGQQWIGKVPQRVIALGYLRDDRLIAMANAAADCVVVPSSVENLPNGVIEAFACGRPVVAFDAGGIRDAVRTGENGILVPAGDADAFAKAIDRLLGPICRELPPPIAGSVGTRFVRDAAQGAAADQDIHQVADPAESTTWKADSTSSSPITRTLGGSYFGSGDGTAAVTSPCDTEY